ncbi:autorepressor SdpR family transcription factor [Spirosoma foliorum]|uniref:Winged helix-turn-helix transcriptional regulator n=1 Tax=Spirosoma foliorum TaxID=2710596 RepID=A0A7G5H3I0_9BACT|nr:autorepressor SdpR family transcription factor [Spirosoma foliorum]QMW05672.1 winged helix-turn-helix transcriptional regulator [Spirosoma foliorum]
MNNLFKALNDPTRRQILDLLREGDLNAGDIAERFDMTKPSISHHLDLLRQAGLVEATKQGQFVNYSLNTTVLDELLAWLMSFQKTETSITEKIPEQKN